MKIAIACDSFPPQNHGGVAASCFNLYSALKKRGVQVKVFTLADKLCPCDKGDIRRTWFPKILDFILPQSLRIFLKIRGNSGGASQLAEAMLGVLRFWRLQGGIRFFNPDILVVPDHGMTDLSSSKSKGYKTIFVSHHNPMRFVNEPLIDNDSSVMDAQLAVNLQQKSLGRMDGVICPSAYMKDIFIKTYYFVRPIEVLPNILDSDYIANIPKLDMHSRYSLSVDTPIIYIPSAGSHLKGRRYVFELVRRIAIIYGNPVAFFLSGSMGNYIKRVLSFTPGNVRLIMPGHLPYEENIGYIKGCTICLSPALLESFGMAQLEAQLCGLPVVALDVGGNREIIDDGATGCLVPFMDIESLISKTLELLDDKTLCQSMSINSIQRAASVFNTDVIINRYLQFFKSIMEQE